MNKPLKFVAACRLPTEWGVFTLHGFEEVRSGQEHVALSMGDIGSDAPVLARVHSECLTGDGLFSQKCDCGPQLQAAMQAVQQAGLPLAGWVANCISPAPHRLEDYVHTLQQRIDAPLLGVMPYLPGQDAAKAADALDIGLLSMLLR